jgi:ABC-2 type transport system permease protein
MAMSLPMIGRQIRWEQKSYWRNPPAAVFTFAFPLLFLVIFTALNGNGTVEIAGGTVKFAQFYVPAIIAFGLISACYTNIAMTVCIRRENGLLKRTRGTPLGVSSYLGGIIGNGVVVALILTALVFALGVIAYGVAFSGRYLALAVAIIVGAFCFSAIGVAVSTFVPNQDAAPAIVNFVLFPLLFISGIFYPVKSSSTLSRIADVFPLRHLSQALVDSFSPYGSGLGINVTHLLVMIAWGVGAALVAMRRFRWEPRIKS